MKAHFTILGSTGFIGSRLTRYLTDHDHSVYCPHRDDASIFGRKLGHVIYCVGLTGDFLTRPLEAVEAHVCLLLKILRQGKFDSLLYLSSTRVYGGAKRASEKAVFEVDPFNPSDIYNLSKLQGEACCYANSNAKVRVARLSNVFGDDWRSENFLSQLIRSAVDQRDIRLQSALDSAKDYVSVDDVVRLLPMIALRGRQRLYNLASGKNVTHRQIVHRLKQLTAAHISVAKNARKISFPLVDIARAKREFRFRPVGVIEALEQLVAGYRSEKTMRR